jgi:hypothetical protein
MTEWSQDALVTGVVTPARAYGTQWALDIYVYGSAALTNYYDYDVSDGISLSAIADGTAPTSVPADTSPFHVGRVLSYWGRERVADMSIWTKALDATDRAALYTGANKPADLRDHPSVASLSRWWRFGNGGACGADSIAGILNQAPGCVSATLVPTNMESGDIITAYPPS